MSYCTITELGKLESHYNSIKEIKLRAKQNENAFNQILIPSMNDIKATKDIISHILFELVKSSSSFSSVGKTLKGHIKTTLESDNIDPQVLEKILQADNRLVLLMAKRTKIAISILKHTSALQLKITKILAQQIVYIV